MKICARSIMALSVIALSMLFTACGIDFEGSDNGKLDGFWHLEKVDTLATGGVTDYSQKRVFWGVQAKLISMYDTDVDSNHGFYTRFTQTSDSLFIHTLYKDNWHEDSGENGGDQPLTDYTPMRPYGINAMEDHFAKEKLSGSRMILKSKMLRLYFRKF